MTDVQIDPAPPAGGPPPDGRTPVDDGRPESWWRQLRAHRTAMVALAYLVLLVVLALGAPLFAPQDPHAQDLTAILSPPSAAHWLGTDDAGRDVLSRMIYATRASLLASAQAVAISMVIGVLAGLVAGWYGRWVDRIVMSLTDAVMSVPGLLLAMAVIGVLGPGLGNAMIGLSLIFTPAFVRLTRAEVLGVKEETFVEAARSVGVRDVTLIRRHVVPNIASPLIVQCFITLGYALLAEGALSYLGLSIQPPEASWGNILQRAFSAVHRAPWLIFIPGLAIMSTILSLQLFGDGLRDFLTGRQAPGAGRD